MNRLFKILGIVLALSAPAGAAQAQQCQADYEQIIDLRVPEIGSYSIWSRIFGEQDAQERFKAGVVLANNNTVLAAERYLQKSGNTVDLILMQLERRGRSLWEKEHQIKGLMAVHKMFETSEGFMLVGEQRTEKADRNRIWIGFFDPEGGLKSEKTIALPGANLQYEDMVQAADGKNYLLAASAERDEEGKYYAVLYRVDAKGAVISDNAYQPGLDNKIIGLAASKSGDYFAAGYLKSEDGRKTGWVLHLTKDGKIIWQRQYPRGRAALFSKVMELGRNGLVLAGEAAPGGGGNGAAWVMMADATSADPLWQRFYRGDMNFAATQLLGGENGTFTALISGRKTDKAQHEYVRLLSLDPRGIALASNEYFNAEGTHAYGLIQGRAGERILLGSTNMVYEIEGKDPKKDPVQKKYGLDAWVSAATAIEPYKDPCVKPEQYMP